MRELKLNIFQNKKTKQLSITLPKRKLPKFFSKPNAPKTIKLKIMEVK